MSCRVHITGASGSGTTTLGLALGDRLQCPAFDADDYYWLPTTPPFRQKREKAERLSLLLPDLGAHSSWILSGSIVSWGESVERCIDRIIFLWIPSEIRLQRLRQREVLRHGRVDEEFIAWASRYDSGDLSVRSRAVHEKWMATMPCPILRLEADLTRDERLARSLEFIATPGPAPKHHAIGTHLPLRADS
jgi:adenylate kinase family enzyme